MALDDLIEQLSFGKATVKVSSCLGLYLSPETIYVAESHIEKGRLAVDHLVRIPVPQPELSGKATSGPATATLTADFLMDNEKLSALITQSMSQTRWSTKDVFVTLSHHFGLARYFTMPAVDSRFWKSAVPLEAKKYIPIPFDLLNYDFQIIPLPPDARGKPRQGCLVAVTQKKNLVNVADLLQALNLNLIGVEVAPCSVLRVWEALDKALEGKPYGQVHFDGGNIRILVADRGFPVFFREVFLGGDAALSDLRKVDLGGCVSFAQKQLSVPALTQVRVSGSSPSLAGFKEAFTQETGTPAVIQDTASLLGVKAGDWGGYAAIGASARFLAPSATTLDLGQVGKISDEEKRAARDILLLSGLLALWFVAAGLVNTFLYHRKAQELLKYKRDKAIEAVFSGKSAAAIEEMIKGMQDQADFTQGLGPDAPKATALLKDIVDSLPEKAWITALRLEDPLHKGGMVGQELTISGSCVGASISEERDMAYQFRDKLAKSPVAGKLFKYIEQPSCQSTPIAEEAKQGLDPDALADKMELRTSFNIVARTVKR